MSGHHFFFSFCVFQDVTPTRVTPLLVLIGKRLLCVRSVYMRYRNCTNESRKATASFAKYSCKLTRKSESTHLPSPLSAVTRDLNPTIRSERPPLCLMYRPSDSPEPNGTLKGTESHDEPNQTRSNKNRMFRNLLQYTSAKDESPWLSFGYSRTKSIKK